MNVVNLFIGKVIQQQVLLTHPPFLFMHKGLFLTREENSKVCLLIAIQALSQVCDVLAPYDEPVK